MGLQAAYANLHTDQERDYFMQRYHDVISSFGGKTSYDADNRPLLVMSSNLWASGYDVDGTDQTSLGQFSGRVQQTYKHSVPRFFVPEHGTMFFFFQAEDGIRDYKVTGVQTCALPISRQRIERHAPLGDLDQVVAVDVPQARERKGEAILLDPLRRVVRRDRKSVV